MEYGSMIPWLVMVLVIAGGLVGYAIDAGRERHRRGMRHETRLILAEREGVAPHLLDQWYDR